MQLFDWCRSRISRSKRRRVRALVEALPRRDDGNLFQSEVCDHTGALAVGAGSCELSGRQASRDGGPMMTPFAKQLGAEFPIFAFSHCRDVVAAVSRAGGVGVLGALGRTPEQLDMELTWIEERLGELPYAVDIV